MSTIIDQEMKWFVLRVTFNKETSIRDTLLSKVKTNQLDQLVGRILLPTEKVKTVKRSKIKVTENKLYPGYLFVEMKLEPDGRIHQDVFSLFKETIGVSDFVGPSGRPTPMAGSEVERMLLDSKPVEEIETIKMEYESGDTVTITEGPFKGYNGIVDEVLPHKDSVVVLVAIFGRHAPTELNYSAIVKS